MRLVAALLALPMAVIFASDAAAAREPAGFAFGRSGGNIRPYTVRIANDGDVKAAGPVAVGHKKLTTIQIGRLNLKAVEVGFAKMPTKRSCSGALPDVAYTFIRVGPRTVRVRGSCMAGYASLWHALARAVKLSVST